MRLTGVGGTILAPGFGAQGTTPSDFARFFGDAAEGAVLASVSRDVLRRGPDVQHLRTAIATWQRQLMAAAAPADLSLVAPRAGA